MPLTNAQHQANDRARRKAKMARYEAALREIANYNPARPMPGSQANKTARAALENKS